MRARVVFSPEARADLIGLYDYIAEQASPQRAMAYIDRIEAYCLAFADFPERGTRRDEIRPGLRTVGFEGRVTLAFHLGKGVVTINRVLYAGRELGED